LKIAIRPSEDAIHRILTAGWPLTRKSTCSSLPRELRQDPSVLTSSSVCCPRQRMMKFEGAFFAADCEEVWR
jgi:hypothetical protein